MFKIQRIFKKKLKQRFKKNWKFKKQKVNTFIVSSLQIKPREFRDDRFISMHKQIRKDFNLFNCSTKQIKLYNKVVFFNFFNFIYLLFSQINYFLVKNNFFKTFSEANLYIKCGYIYIYSFNKFIFKLNTSNYFIKNNDVVFINPFFILKTYFFFNYIRKIKKYSEYNNIFFNFFKKIVLFFSFFRINYFKRKKKFIKYFIYNYYIKKRFKYYKKKRAKRYYKKTIKINFKKYIKNFMQNINWIYFIMYKCSFYYFFNYIVTYRKYEKKNIFFFKKEENIYNFFIEKDFRFFFSNFIKFDLNYFVFNYQIWYKFFPNITKFLFFLNVFVYYFFFFFFVVSTTTYDFYF